MMYRVETTEDLSTATEPVAERPSRQRAPRVVGPTGFAKIIKRAIDIVGALFFLTFGMPIYLAVALGVRLSSPGPVHYYQYRLGQGGKRFKFYKFRSMVVDADEVLTSFLDSNSEARSQWETHQKLKTDPRITPFGKFIRKTSLDEIPQFWNVLTGDMSIVGPRPCMEGQNMLYGDTWNVYCSVKPGITGLWQVSGRSRLTYAERVRLDEQYITTWSLLLDFKILAKTVVVVLTRHGAV